ncbi:hypothetical protein P8452_19466 [Trifolium repens]|nr:hypothetical protein P8452_19466 [Trifolium repens]
MDPKVDNDFVTGPSKGEASNKAKGKEKEKEEGGDKKELDIEELETRIWRNKKLLKRLKEERAQRDYGYSLEQLEKMKRKTMFRAQDGVLGYMLKMMEVCNAHGFVYGIVLEDGRTVSGSSENLRAWWKEEVKFDKNSSAAISKYDEENGISSMNEANLPHDDGSALVESDGELRQVQVQPNSNSDDVSPMNNLVESDGEWRQVQVQPKFNSVDVSPMNNLVQSDGEWRQVQVQPNFKSDDVSPMNSLVESDDVSPMNNLVQSGGEWRQVQVQPNLNSVDVSPMNNLVESGGNKRKVDELVESTTTTKNNEGYTCINPQLQYYNQGGDVNNSSHTNFSSIIPPYEVVANKRKCEVGMRYNNQLQQDMNVRNNHHFASPTIGSSSSGGINNNQLQMVDVGGSNTHQHAAPLDQHVQVALPVVDHHAAPLDQHVQDALPIVANHTGNYSGGGGEGDLMDIYYSGLRLKKNDAVHVGAHGNPNSSPNYQVPNAVVGATVPMHQSVSTATIEDLRAYNSPFDVEDYNNYGFSGSSSNVQTPSYDFSWFYNKEN